jgi:hypothetical protein
MSAKLDQRRCCIKKAATKGSHKIGKVFAINPSQTVKNPRKYCRYLKQKVSIKKVVQTKTST